MQEGQGLMFASLGIVQEILDSFNQSTQELKMGASGQQGAAMGWPCGARNMRPSKKHHVYHKTRGEKEACFKKKSSVCSNSGSGGLINRATTQNIQQRKWIQTTVWIFQNHLVKFLWNSLEHHWRRAIPRKTSNHKNLEQRLGLNGRCWGTWSSFGLYWIMSGKVFGSATQVSFYCNRSDGAKRLSQFTVYKMTKCRFAQFFYYSPFTGYVSGCRSAPFKGGLRPNWGYGRDEEREGWSGQGAQDLHLLAGKRESHWEYIPLQKATQALSPPF